MPDGGIRLLFAFLAYLLVYRYAVKSFGFMAAHLGLGITYCAVLLFPLLPFVNSRPAEDLFLLLFVYLIFSVVVYMLFDIQKHKISIVFWQVLMLFTFLKSLFLSVDKLDSGRYDTLKSTFIEFPMVTVAYLGALAFVQMLFINFKRENHNSHQQLLEKNEELLALLKTQEEQRTNLENQQKDLYQLREELHDVHDQLRDKIEDRTRRLTFLNEVLEKYGFINTQLVIKPVQLLQENMKNGDLDGNLPKIESIVDEMDDLTGVVSDFLNETAPEKLEKLETKLKDEYGIVL
jgi:hypothetical protein